MSNTQRHTDPGKNSAFKREQVPAGPFFAKAAILVDGEFFLRRLAYISNTKDMTAENAAKALEVICVRHAKKAQRNIYRIFFYDCAPFSKKLFNPISRKTIDYAKSEKYAFRTEFHNLLRQKRKFALRLGHLSDDENARWLIKTSKVNELLNKKITIEDLQPEDIIPNLRQKQVDMKIGVDIASLTLKQQVDTIILIAGDGDFVPAAKLARREGIDFILDPMYQRIQPDLFEHIDGLHSTWKKRESINYFYDQP